MHNKNKYIEEVLNTKILPFVLKPGRYIGNEINILLNVPENMMKEVIDERLIKAIMLNREGKIEVDPGYDGVYGKPMIANEMKLRRQKTLSEF